MPDNFNNTESKFNHFLVIDHALRIRKLQQSSLGDTEVVKNFSGILQVLDS